MTAPACTTSSFGQKTFAGSLLAAEVGSALLMLLAVRSLLQRRLARRPGRPIPGHEAPQIAAVNSVALW